MFRTRRLCRHYIVKRKGNTISIHHTPFWIFYFLTRKAFLLKRRRAYEIIASLLLEEKGRFWRNIEFVKSNSFWIDFKKETKHVDVQHASLLFHITDFYLRLGNIRNWFFIKTLFRNVTKKQMYCLSLSRNEFIRTYRGGF